MHGEVVRDDRAAHAERAAGVQLADEPATDLDGLEAAAERLARRRLRQAVRAVRSNRWSPIDAMLMALPPDVTAMRDWYARRAHARVAELADAQDSGSCARKGVGVQVPPRARVSFGTPREAEASIPRLAASSRAVGGAGDPPPRSWAVAGRIASMLSIPARGHATRPTRGRRVDPTPGSRHRRSGRRSACCRGTPSPGGRAPGRASSGRGRICTIAVDAVRNAMLPSPTNSPTGTRARGVGATRQQRASRRRTRADATMTSRTSIVLAPRGRQRTDQRTDADDREQQGERGVAAVERARDEQREARSGS